MKKLEIAFIIVLALLALAFVCGCEESPAAEPNEPVEEQVTTMTPFEAEMEWWNEKDENGVSNAARMAESNRQAIERTAERKRQAEEAAIEREAEIQARAALKLIELMEKR